MRTSAQMGLRIWNLLLDPYDHEQLADNWAKVDAHDHSPGRGVLIPTEGLADESVSFPILASSVFPEVSAEGGELTLEASEEKPLAGGPELTVPATGIYQIGLQLKAEWLVEGPGALGFVAQNGSSVATLFEVKLPEGSRIKTTNYTRLELDEGDELTVAVATESAGNVAFSEALISIWRVA